jgi:hypothetical protein
MFVLGTRKIFLGEIQVFLQRRRVDLLKQREPNSTLKKQCCRTYFFQKATQFSQGSNVLDMPASRPDGVLVSDTCVSLPKLDRSFCNKGSLSQTVNVNLQEVFLSKSNSAFSGEKMC